MTPATKETTKNIAREKSSKEGEDITLEEMVKCGVHLGHHISKLHPKMSPFIIGIRNNTHIINLKKTKEKLMEALNFIREIAEKGGQILIVGTKPPLGKIVKELSQELNLPYVSERWLGGTFTNFEVIKKRINYYKELKEKFEKGEFEDLSKKEKRRKEREFEKLKLKFEGIKDMEKLPEAVFICDVSDNIICLNEAKKTGVKTIAICDTDTDPSDIDYPIPANNDAIPSVRYILEKVKKVIKETKKERE